MAEKHFFMESCYSEIFQEQNQARKGHFMNVGFRTQLYYVNMDEGSDYILTNR